MNDNGWIKIRKSIYNHWLWENAEYLKWWIDLLLMANWEDDKKLVGKQLVEVKRGQLIASMSFLMNRWGRSRKMIEHFLNLLYKEQMISKDVKHNISLITISNYDKHQANDKEMGKAQKGASKGAHNGAHLENDLITYKSETYSDSESDSGAHLGAYQGAEVGAHLGAYQGATIKEYKESKNNISSLNSELCNESKDSLRCISARARENEVEALDYEVVDRDNIPWKKIQNMYNAICVSYKKCLSITEKRKPKIRARVKEMGGVEQAMVTLETVFKKMEDSNFMKGLTGNTFKADFDWVFYDDTHWVKILEGKYDNDKQPQQLQMTYGNSNNTSTFEQRAATVARIVSEGIAASREELRNRGRVPDPVLPF